MPLRDVSVGLACAMVAFAVCAVACRILIRVCRDKGFCGPDMNKIGRPPIPEMGGLAVMAALIIGSVLFLALKGTKYPFVTYGALATVLGIALVGLYDDLKNLSRGMKAVLPFVLSLPFGYLLYQMSMDSAPGLSILILPYLGRVELGWLLILVVPLGITCAANATNMLEGLNGLAGGLSLIIITFLILIAYLRELDDALYLLFPMAGALAAFLLFNIYPAKIFPGDVLTLSTGAVMASAAFLGQLKFVGAILLLPMIVEFFLKTLGKLRRVRKKKTGWGHNFGELDLDGRLHHRGEIESLVHLVLKFRPMKEWQVVAVLWLLEILVGLAAVNYVINL